MYKLLILLVPLLFIVHGSSATADVVDYTIDWVAAAPASYNHATGGGAYDDRTLRSDVANALVGNNFTCGDTVSFFAQITIDEPATAETIEFVVAFGANSLIAPGVGFVEIRNVAVNYGTIEDLIAGENTIDDGILDDGGSTATLVDEHFEPAGGLLGGSLYENPLTQADLIGVIRIDDLEATDSAVVVRIDVKLDCTKGSIPLGLLQAELRDAKLVAPLIGDLSIGIQSIIFSRVDQILFPPDIANLHVTQHAPPVIKPGEPLTYTVVLANDGPDPALRPQLTNTLPTSATFAALNNPAGWACTTPAVGETGLLGCHQDQLAAGTVVTFTIEATTRPTIPLRTLLTNTVVVTSPTLDLDLPNVALVTTTVSAPLLTVSKVGALHDDTDGSGFLSPGDTVAYTVTVANRGNAVATGLVFSDTLDLQSQLITASVQTNVGLLRQTSARMLQVDLATLPGEGTPFVITFQAQITNSATILTSTVPTSPVPTSPVPATVLRNQGILYRDGAPPQLSDDPTTAAFADATLLSVTPLGAYYPCMAIPDSECAVLQALYRQTNGALWKNHQGWFVTTDPCTWYGLTCTTDEEGQSHISAITLADNLLQGTIPTILDQLPWLQQLDLGRNTLAGIVPATIGNLPQLVYLNLADNGLVGELPASLGNLKQLRKLYLFGNNFSGDLPVTLRNLAQLETLYLQSTQLCLPPDPLLQDWLTTVTNVTPPADADCRHIDLAVKPLVLVYAGLDNNLSAEWGRLINNLEAGTNTDAFTVKLLIDGYGEGNSYEFLLQHDTDPTCPSLVTGFLECNRYRRGATLRNQSEDTAQRDLLATFVINALYEQPNASQVILVLVGHGSGWGANGLPAQPRGWTEQNGLFTDIAGGILWDDTAGDGALASRSLSTRALGEAVQQVKAVTGRGIDLLYLDACSMAMAEVAYEVHESVDYLLASENTKWATFPYDQLLPYVAEGLDAATLGSRWLDTEAALLNRVPDIDYTFSLLSLAGMTNVMTATTLLADTLAPLLPARLSELDQTLAATAFFDSNYDGLIDETDNYIDLFDLAGKIATTFADEDAIATAAHELQQAVSKTVVREIHQNGTILQRNPSQWNGIGGISVYWPLAVDEQKRLTLYNALNLQWAADSTWDEWLSFYWQSVEDRRLTALETCAQTAGCPGLTGWGFVDIPPAQQIFLPMVQR